MDRTVEELIEHITARTAAGRSVTLAPRSAATVVRALRMYATRVGRDEVVPLLCPRRCTERCMTCVGKANEIVHLFEGAPRALGHDPLYGPPGPGNSG